MTESNATGDLLTRVAPALAGTYAIQREIGQGGMAIVCLALDLKHERPVAIKVFRPDVTGSMGAERFLRVSRPPPIFSTLTSWHSSIPAWPTASRTT